MRIRHINLIVLSKYFLSFVYFYSCSIVLNSKNINGKKEITSKSKQRFFFARLQLKKFKNLA